MRPFSVVDEENVYLVMSDPHPHDPLLVDAVLLGLAQRAAVHDPNDADPAPRPVGGPSLRLVWYRGCEWTLENVAKLLCATRTHLRAQADLTAGTADDDALELAERVVRGADEYVRALAAQHAAGQLDVDVVAAFVFWLAVLFDTRIERLACKRNMYLAARSLSVPPERSVNHIRNTLRPILAHLVRGQYTRAAFFDALTLAYAVGMVEAPPTPPPPNALRMFGEIRGRTDYRRLLDPQATTEQFCIKLVDGESENVQ